MSRDDLGAWRPAAGAAMLLLFAAAFHPATAAAAGQRRAALVVGNAQYEQQRDLPNAARDARAVAGRLEALGFSVVEVDDESLAGLKAALADMRLRARGADVLVVYYAGHGLSVDGTDRLVPVDARLRAPSDIAAETLALPELVAALADARRPLIVFLDACRTDPRPDSGPSPQAGRGADANAFDLAAERRARDGDVGAVQRAVIIHAAQAGTVTREGKNDRGPFAAALVERLGMRGATLAELSADVRTDVLGATLGTQTPDVAAGPDADIILAPLERPVVLAPLDRLVAPLDRLVGASIPSIDAAPSEGVRPRRQTPQDPARDRP